MLNVVVASEARYKIDRRMVRKHIVDEWALRKLPDGEISVAFVGSRKAKELANTYLHDNQAHPVLTVPFPPATHFPLADTEKKLLGEIVICFQQVVLFSAQQNKSVDAVIRQFLDHSITILSEEIRNT